MAGYNKYDPRIDDLVMETRTLWDPEIGDELDEQDQEWLAHAVHQSPEAASNVSYERSHTGFTRVIKVTVADIQRLYLERVNSE